MAPIPQPVLHTLSFSIGFVFLWSGGVKLRDLHGFALIATSYSLVPRQLSRPVRWVALTIPFIETLTGGLLIIQELQQPALIAIGVSLIGYIFLEIVELWQDTQMDNCGCYGTAIEAELTWKQVAKNIVLLACTALLLLQARGMI